MDKTPLYIKIGFVLFVAYVVQLFIEPKLEFLFELQQQQMYKRWSGLVLFSVILFQWVLTLFRMIKPRAKAAQRLLTIHQWLGALSPLFFYIHSMEFGFGYLLILSLIYYFNFLLGLLNLRVLKSLGTKAFRAWYLTHILASILILGIGIFHIWMVFYYE